MVNPRVNILLIAPFPLVHSMSTIAITGHSRGLGRYLAKELSFGHDIMMPLSRIENISSLVDEIRHCDVFINNAHSGFSQVELFLSLYRLWRCDSSKLIINIGSRAAEPNISLGFEYSASKAALMHAVKSTVFLDEGKLCRVSLLNLGLLNSDIPSLSYSSVLLTINHIISLDSVVEMPVIYLNHAAPYPYVQAHKKYRKSSDMKW